MAWDNGANSASAWLIYEAEDLEVSLNTVGDKSYASVYLPFPVQANGVNAYTGIISGKQSGRHSAQTVNENVVQNLF